MHKVIGTPESLKRFFNATQLFQSHVGLAWLVNESTRMSDSCYEISESDNVKHCSVILQAIAVAAGCHIERFEAKQ